MLRKDWATYYSPVSFTLLVFTFLPLIPRKPLKSYLSVLAVISLPKSLATTFCSSLGSTLLFIENTAIDPITSWVIRSELVLESLETFLTFVCPLKLDAFVKQICQRLGNLGEVLDETAPIAGESEETSDLLDSLGGKSLGEK